MTQPSAFNAGDINVITAAAEQTQLLADDDELRSSGFPQLI